MFSLRSPASAVVHGCFWGAGKSDQTNRFCVWLSSQEKHEQSEGNEVCHGENICSLWRHCAHLLDVCPLLPVCHSLRVSVMGLASFPLPSLCLVWEQTWKPGGKNQWVFRTPTSVNSKWLRPRTRMRPRMHALTGWVHFVDRPTDWPTTDRVSCRAACRG